MYKKVFLYELGSDSYSQEAFEKASPHPIVASEDYILYKTSMVEQATASSTERLRVLKSAGVVIDIIRGLVMVDTQKESVAQAAIDELLTSLAGKEHPQLQGKRVLTGDFYNWATEQLDLWPGSESLADQWLDSESLVSDHIAATLRHIAYTARDYGGDEPAADFAMDLLELFGPELLFKNKGSTDSLDITLIKPVLYMSVLCTLATKESFLFEVLKKTHNPAVYGESGDVHWYSLGSPAPTQEAIEHALRGFADIHHSCREWIVFNIGFSHDEALQGCSIRSDGTLCVWGAIDIRSGIVMLDTAVANGAQTLVLQLLNRLACNEPEEGSGFSAIVSDFADFKIRKLAIDTLMEINENADNQASFLDEPPEEGMAVRLAMMVYENDKETVEQMLHTILTLDTDGVVRECQQLKGRPREQIARLILVCSMVKEISSLFKYVKQLIVARPLIERMKNKHG